MHVHLVGVCGSGMGAFAGLLRQSGHRVSGSDQAFHPPMGPALTAWGVETWIGYSQDHLVPRPDLVIVGNVCRKDNEEARAAMRSDVDVWSLPQAIAHFFLATRPSYVIAGTHGKTTTTALAAHLLTEANREPGFLLGGFPRNFFHGFAVGAQNAPFVIEGDEYDSAFFEKSPKFWRYRAQAAVLTSVEHDHIDIYPSREDYLEAFREFVRRLPSNGTLVAYAGDPTVRELAANAPCHVIRYALDTDETGDEPPDYLGYLGPTVGGCQPIDVFVRGSLAGRVLFPLFGEHNARNLLAALALLGDHGGVPMDTMVRGAQCFLGVRRRQHWVGTADAVAVYDDFAHHPSAVRETLRALRRKHPNGKLIAAYEPRSATASRNLHQDAYVAALSEADAVVLAPVGRRDIAVEERLDTDALASALRRAQRPSVACKTIAETVQACTARAAPGDTIVAMSNGTFDNIWDELLLQLLQRSVEKETSRRDPQD